MSFSLMTEAQQDGLTAFDAIETYFKNVDFEDYTKHLRPSEVKDFIKFFDCLKKGLTMIDRIGEGVDRGGRKYRFYNFIKARALTGCKIFPMGNWDVFINDYQEGNIRIAFTGEELVEEAMNH